DLGRNFLEHDFQHAYATKFTARILTQERREWFTEYQQLRSNEPLFDFVQEHHPEVLEFFSARFEIVRIAQRLEVQPAPPPDPEPQRKETPEEYFERKRRRLKNNAQLKLAKTLEQLEATRRLREQAEQVGSD